MLILPVRRASWQLAFVAVSVLARPAASQTPPAGFWRGSATTTRVSPIGLTPNGVPLVTLLIRYDSDFWFTANSAGEVVGMATVRYEMSLNDGRLRGIAAAMNSAANTALGQFVPLLGGVVGTGVRLKDLVGMSASYDEGIAVREWRITGRVNGEHVHLEWAAPPNTLPYTIKRVYVTRDEVISRKDGPAYSPWEVDARITRAAPNEWHASVPGTASNGTKGSLTWTTYWFAARSSTGP